MKKRSGQDAKPQPEARTFVRDMHAYFAEKGGIKKDGAAGTLHMLKQHYVGKLRITDIREMFRQMKDQV